MLTTDFQTTDKLVASLIARLLVAHGIQRIVMSPGSRNAPLMVAVAREAASVVSTVIVDERCAGFYALGQSLGLNAPVAVICTSGTALLNLAPAVAEAYYRGVPLIVISADRPSEWIDQDDSQTLKQPGALANFVKRTYDLTPDCSQEVAEREINDALLTAISRRQGPVHINVRLDTPLGGMIHASSLRPARVISMSSGRDELSAETMARLSDDARAADGILIVAGYMHPDAATTNALRRLSSMPGVAVVAEPLSNISGADIINRVEAAMAADHDYPSLVITLGGALVSRRLKEYIRSTPTSTSHWHVGHTHGTVDCYRRLTHRVDVAEGPFLGALADELDGSVTGSWGARWRLSCQLTAERHDDYIGRAPWSDLRAMSLLLSMLPSDIHLHLSNGTAVRYVQMVDMPSVASVDCNRGVSGIDGSTSTALGAASVYDTPTLLVTGDMSAQYDIGALASVDIPRGFRMVVLNNGGGAIFRTIESTSRLEERTAFFDTPSRNASASLRAVVEAVGMEWVSIDDEASFLDCMGDFLDGSDRPKVMEIVTDGAISAAVMKELTSLK